MNDCCYLLFKMVQVLFKFSCLNYWVHGHLYLFSRNIFQRGHMLYICLFVKWISASVRLYALWLYKEKSVLEVQTYWKFVVSWKFEYIFFIWIFVAFRTQIYSFFWSLIAYLKLSLKYTISIFITFCLIFN